MSLKNIDTGFYADNSRLDRYRNGNDEKSLDAVAREFEALYLQKLLKSARDAGESFKSDLTESSYTSQYEEMYHNQLATQLAHKGGIGLAEAIKKQMLPHVKANAAPEDASQVQPNINYKKSPYISPNVSVEQLDKFTKFSTPNDFINKLTPTVNIAAKELGVDPKILIAQAALETGWGQHTNGTYNLFGIKANNAWQENKASKLTTTHEFINGVKTKVVDKFRSYQDYQESIKDYIGFIKNNKNYKKALNVAADPNQYMQELQSAGYATDPDYANKVLKIYDKIKVAMK